MDTSRTTNLERDRAWDLAVVGHTNVDRFLEVDALPEPDRTVPVSRQRTELGGTAATIARVASRLGLAVTLVSRVGEEFPELFRDMLTADRVDLSGVETVLQASSPTCFIVEDGRGSQMTFIDQGPMGDASRGRVPMELLGAATWVHLTTGDPIYILRMREAARRAGCRVAIDPAQEIHYRWTREMLRQLFEDAEIFFGNAAEADRAAKMLGAKSPRELVDRVPLVVVTRGARGAVAYTRTGTVRVSASSGSRTTRVTGAGDAFRGGFYAAWLGGEELEECLERAAREAARWIRREGRTRKPGHRASTGGSGRR